MPEEGSQPAPLKITCTSTKCDQNLHCFKQTRRMKAAQQKGPCRECGADLVDFNRVYQMSLTDVAYAFTALRHELIRHHYWHIEFDIKALNHARRKGKITLKADAEKRIRRTVGLATPYRDGTQTPREGNVICYAQHATACCCRKCIEVWYGIPQGEPLTEAQISYFTAIVNLYIEERLPHLKDLGEKVPRLPSVKPSREEESDAASDVN